MLLSESKQMFLSIKITNCKVQMKTNIIPIATAIVVFSSLEQNYKMFVWNIGRKYFLEDWAVLYFQFQPSLSFWQQVEAGCQ